MKLLPKVPVIAQPYPIPRASRKGHGPVWLGNVHRLKVQLPLYILCIVMLASCFCNILVFFPDLTKFPCDVYYPSCRPETTWHKHILRKWARVWTMLLFLEYYRIWCRLLVSSLNELPDDTNTMAFVKEISLLYNISSFSDLFLEKFLHRSWSSFFYIIVLLAPKQRIICTSGSCS